MEFFFHLSRTYALKSSIRPFGIVLTHHLITNGGRVRVRCCVANVALVFDFSASLVSALSVHLDIGYGVRYAGNILTEHCVFTKSCAE